MHSAGGAIPDKSQLDARQTLFWQTTLVSPAVLPLRRSTIAAASRCESQETVLGPIACAFEYKLLTVVNFTATGENMAFAEFTSLNKAECQDSHPPRKKLRFNSMSVYITLVSIETKLSPSEYVKSALSCQFLYTVSIDMVGTLVGILDGTFVGLKNGAYVGLNVLATPSGRGDAVVGTLVGADEGKLLLGDELGALDGAPLGFEDGIRDGRHEGLLDG